MDELIGLLVVGALVFFGYELVTGGNSDTILGGGYVDSSSYSSNPNYLQWAPTINSATSQYGLPAGLLANLLYVESHYRTDIINGTTSSSAGAQGIAQFMPATAAQYGINPLDPSQAIPAAAKMVAALYSEFGTWPLAVAAYNWGSGNVQKWLDGDGATVPAETQNYVSNILGVTLNDPSAYA
jgi:soluble lytic murein transglycosylase-like protein